MFSVVMSVYNEKKSDLQKSIESILRQTYREFEFIIILDMPRNTELDDLLNFYSKNDDRIIYVKNEKNIGLAESLNKGIKLSKHDYIIRMDADDISLENRLDILRNNLDVDTDVYFSKYVVIDDADNEKKVSENMPNDSKRLKKILNYKNIICHPTVMIKKSTLSTNEYYSDLKNSEDFELWTRLIKNDAKFKGVNEVLLKYRIRENSMTTSDYYKSYFALKYITKYYKKNNEKLDNKKFQAAYSKDKCNKKKYNYFATQYNTLVQEWGTMGIKKYFKLLHLLIKEPQLVSYCYRTGKSLFLRRRA